jgi:hypothetical protein
VLPKLRELIQIIDSDDDTFPISRLDRATGSREYLLSITSGEVHATLFPAAEDLENLAKVIDRELGEP